MLKVRCTKDMSHKFRYPQILPSWSFAGNGWKCKLLTNMRLMLKTEFETSLRSLITELLTHHAPVDDAVELRLKEAELYSLDPGRSRFQYGENCSHLGITSTVR